MKPYEGIVSSEINNIHGHEFQGVEHKEDNDLFEGLSTGKNGGFTRDSDESRQIKEAVESIF